MIYRELFSNGGDWGKRESKNSDNEKLQGLKELSGFLGCARNRIRLMDPGSEASEGDKVGV